MASTPTADEREAGDPRPLVRTSMSGNAGLWIFLAVLLIGGLLLFQALSSRRLDAVAPVTQYESGGATITAPPPLRLPDNYFAPVEAIPGPVPAGSLPPPSPQQVPYFPARAVTRIAEVPATPLQTQAPPVMPIQGEPLPPRPAVVFDAGVAPVRPAEQASAEDERVMATRLRNPAFTVPKGTVLPAVLESALDSTRAGQVRALITRDVMGFDGSRVLIPRGSRLYGEYASDLNYGQNRALVQWTRLLRPDGVMINLDSPAADPLGRAGIRGKVNSHFWSRFGAAILQSVLDIGVNVASRQVDDTVVVALPGSTQNVSRSLNNGQQEVRPTLTVRQGTGVSVFVARDLDFSTVEQ